MPETTTAYRTGLPRVAIYFLRPRELLRGTFAPLRRDSLSAIAIACLRLLTRRPDPLLSVPRFRRCIADFTFFETDFPYLRIFTSAGLWCKSRARMLEP